MSLCFVDNRNIDENVRQRIRSHVMIGKNAGRVIERGAQLRTSQIHRKGISKPSHGASRSILGVIEQCGAMGAVHRLIGHHYSGFPFPSALSGDSRQIVHHYFSVVAAKDSSSLLCAPTNLKQTMWMRSMSWDEAYFHCTIAIMAACCASFVQHGDLSSEVLSHISRAVSLINKKLSGAEALSEVTICSVLGLVIFEQLQGEQHKWSIHMAGLQRIIQLCGGLEQFREMPDLVHKICRTDLDFAFSYGQPTRFKPHHIPLFITDSALHAQFTSQAARRMPETFRKVNRVLRNLAVDILAFSYALNDTRVEDVHRHQFQASLISLGYRLCDFHAVGNSAFSAGLDEMLYLGLVAFVTSLLSRSAGMGVLEDQPFWSRLELFLRTGHNFGMDINMALWLLVLSNILLLQRTDKLHALPTMRDLSAKININDAARFHHILMNYPFVAKIHEHTTEQIWDAIKSQDLAEPPGVG